MPIIIPTGFADVAIELKHSGDPDPWYVTMGVAHTVDAGSYEEIGQSVNNAWGSMVQPMLSNTVSNTGVKVSVGTGDEPVRLFVPQNAVFVPGGSADNRLPQNCALLVRKNSNLGGRRNTGRFFVPGILADEIVSGVGEINVLTLAAIQEAFNNFFENLGEDVGPDAPSTPMVILHHTEGVTTPPSPTPVSSLTCSSTLSTQRRRLR